ncbi:MAG: hypothetical protein HOF21_11125 [Nitrospina sp.]|jgi:hypothetical protein|nr:hypothetical protein [Nitrospina sp.]
MNFIKCITLIALIFTLAGCGVETMSRSADEITLISNRGSNTGPAAQKHCAAQGKTAEFLGIQQTNMWSKAIHKYACR